MTIRILLITAQLHFYHKLVKYLNKIIFNGLSNFIIKHKIINKNQYGLVKIEYNNIAFEHSTFILQKNSEIKKLLQFV